MPHPYQTLPDRSFWKLAVDKGDRTAFPGLYEPRVKLGPKTRVATAGSCFAQHIGARLKRAGVHLLDAEPAPPFMSDALAKSFGYRLFSGRWGNIYTARQMRQLLDEIADGAAEPRFVWQDGDRFRDAFRPTIEPEGLATPEEVLLHRDYHLERSSRMLRQADVFIFTLGLTEAWADRDTGRVFPLCPGVAGGTFDDGAHAFENFRHGDILADLHAIRTTLHRFNPHMQMMLTVSPVPLTATATGNHVLDATSWSKSTLRAAVGDFVADTQGTDYAPSFEIVTHPASGGPWFAPNMRSVSEAGVEKVMSIFLAAHGLSETVARDDTPETDEVADEGAGEYCDEILLQAFAG